MSSMRVFLCALARRVREISRADENGNPVDSSFRRGIRSPGLRSSSYQIQEENVKLLKLTAALSVLMLLALCAAAQEPAAIAAIALQTPKNGMLKQYEDARKQRVEWHKQQVDTQGLFVFQILTGDHTARKMAPAFAHH